MSSEAVISQVKSWLTPSLVVIIGYLAKSKLNEIDAKLDLISSVQGQLSVVQVKTDRNTQDITDNNNALADLQHEFFEHLYATKEEEIKPKKDGK